MKRRGLILNSRRRLVGSVSIFLFFSVLSPASESVAPKETPPATTKATLPLNALQLKVRAGDHTGALAEFRKTTSAELLGTAPAQFVEGYLLMKTNQPAEARKKFQAVTIAKDELSPYAAFFMGQMSVEAGKNEDAHKDFVLAESLKPQQKLWNENAFQILTLDISEKRWGDTKKRLNQLDSNLRREPDYPRVLWLKAQADLALGQKAYACASLRKLYSRYPHFPAISDWGPELSENTFMGQKSGCFADDEDFRQRLRFLLFHGEITEAEKEMRQRRDEIAKTSKYEADMLEAAFLLQRAESPSALKILKAHVESRKSDEKFRTLLASTLARAGESAAAVGIYDQLAKEHGKGRMAAEYLYRGGILCYQTQDYDGASKRFEQLVKKDKRGRQALEARWHLAWISYLKGRYPSALKELDQIPIQKNRLQRTSFQQRAMYWKAVTNAKLKKWAQARDQFETLARADATGFYGLAARSRIGQIDAVMPPAKLKAASVNAKRNDLVRATLFAFASEDSPRPVSNFEEALADEEETVVKATLGDDDWEDQDVPIAGTDGGLLEQGEVTADGVPTKSSVTGESAYENRVLEVRVLASLGLDEWARWELFEVEKSLPRRSPLRANLIKDYQDLQMYNRSSTLALAQWNRRVEGLAGKSREIAEAVFPRAFRQNVDQHSQAFNVPREFVWSIMKAESSYRAQAVSPVGALGLMQVMPVTGKKIAELLKDSTFQPPQLLTPDTAIKFGTRYLSRLLGQFNQNIALAAAGYNAGPHRVQQWLSSFGDLELDEFIEHIPYVETRNYVKKVLAYTMSYRSIYEFDPQTNPIPNLASTLNVRFDGPPPTRESWDDI